MNKDNMRKIPAAERVLEYILDEMDGGRLVPGGRVNAARISAQLSLSAAPVREALSVLAGRGVLELLPDRGAIIRPLSPDEVCQLWELIASIGGLGLRSAGAAVREGRDTSELRQRYESILEAIADGTPIRLMSALNEWHFTANALGGNSFVNAALDRLGVPYWDRFLIAHLDVNRHIAGYRDNYRRMHDAVLAGDGHTAESALRFHAEWSIGLIKAAAAAKPARRVRARSAQG